MHVDAVLHRSTNVFRTSSLSTHTMKHHRSFSISATFFIQTHNLLFLLMHHLLSFIHEVLLLEWVDLLHVRTILSSMAWFQHIFLATCFLLCTGWSILTSLFLIVDSWLIVKANSSFWHLISWYLSLFTLILNDYSTMKSCISLYAWLNSRYNTSLPIAVLSRSVIAHLSIVWSTMAIVLGHDEATIGHIPWVLHGSVYIQLMLLLYQVSLWFTAEVRFSIWREAIETLWALIISIVYLSRWALLA